MSLLLDALKKAAEKKAKKSAADIEDTETRGIDDSTIQETQILDATEVDATVYEQTELPTQIDSTEVDTSPQLFTDEDRTLLIHDDEDLVGHTAVEDQDNATQTEITDSLSVNIDNAEQEALTDDDVTEFMGDGLRDDTQELSIATTGSANTQSDDTTITNSDSLSLTNIEFDDLTLEQIKERENFIPQASSDGYPESSPNFNEEVTSSTVDLDQLTSDETVTLKSTTATRTFAPDNYDRTLLKLADSDVSRIFSGMKSESDAVMTPDYAKKVFLTKSKGSKAYYYKLYTGVAISILLIVAIWGLFQVQDESDLIDNKLAGLKRDPMPGVIKPKQVGGSESLFNTDLSGVDNRVIDIISKAELNEDEVVRTQDLPEDFAIQEDKDIKSAGAESSTDQSDAMSSKKAPVSNLEQSLSKKVVESLKKSTPSSSEVQITSTSQIPEKDQLLAAAYESYEGGDVASARRLYNQVLSLDPENRDALLGRAAIHVQDGKFESAIQHYQQLLVANPKDSVALTSLISVVNIDPKVGESQIKNLLRDQPDSPYLHFALGNMYGSQKRWVEAQSSYFTALQNKAGDPNYAYNLAVSLEHIEQPGTAIMFYQRALDNSNHSLATFNNELVKQRIEVLSR